MPSPCVPVGAALACASIAITSALVLVEILVPHLQLLTVCASFVCDTFKLHQSLAARLDGFNILCLSWPVLQRLESLCCITGTVRIKIWWLDHRCCLRHDPARCTQKVLDLRSQFSSKLRKQQKFGFPAKSVRCYARAKFAVVYTILLSRTLYVAITEISISATVFMPMVNGRKFIDY